MSKVDKTEYQKEPHRIFLVRYDILNVRFPDVVKLWHMEWKPKDYVLNTSNIKLNSYNHTIAITVQ